MATPQKLHGRAFYESIGSPKYVVAPMVDQSEFAWRLLTRSFLPPELRTSILAYSPMFHAKLFAESPKYRMQHFEAVKPAQPSPHASIGSSEESSPDALLDGNPKVDRPLFVQFCANDPDMLLQAAKSVQSNCDAVDLNLGCPQGIAKRGNYGAFLQEDWDTIYKLINTLHKNLDVPVTAKMRILETKERTLEYAKMILSAGASIITVHGRQRDQKGHNTGLADWTVIRYLRENLPPETVMFANGNILQHSDLQRCLDATQADAVMSAEGNLFDPSIFAPPPAIDSDADRDYWRGRDGKGGYRVDAVLRRYLDIIHKYVLGVDPPKRKPLAVASEFTHSPKNQPPEQHNGAQADSSQTLKRSASDPSLSEPNKKSKFSDPVDDAQDETSITPTNDTQHADPKNKKKDKKKLRPKEKTTNPNLVAMQPHTFHILRSLVSTHHPIRDALASCRAGDMEAYEHVLSLVEAAVSQGLREYQTDPEKFESADLSSEPQEEAEEEVLDERLSSAGAIKRCKRPFWVCQSVVRPLPAEAVAKGSLRPKKEKEKKKEKGEGRSGDDAGMTVEEGGRVEVERVVEGEEGTEVNGEDEREKGQEGQQRQEGKVVEVEVPKEGVVCG